MNDETVMEQQASRNRLTLMRRLRHVRQPVFVRRLISFFIRPPDINRPSGAGNG